MAKNQDKEIELHPDAMERFERAVRTVAKAPPQHRVSKKKQQQKKPRKATRDSKSS